MESNLALNCQRAFLNYYETSFLMTLKIFPRPFYLGVMLLLVKCVWYLSLLVSEQSINHISLHDQDFEDFEFIVLFKEYQNNFSILLILLIINGFFIFLCILFISLHIAGVPRPRFILYISSFIAQTYNYILFTPSMYYSLKNLSNSPLSFPNLLLTIMIGMSAKRHFFKLHSFRVQD